MKCKTESCRNWCILKSLDTSPQDSPFPPWDYSHLKVNEIFKRWQWALKSGKYGFRMWEHLWNHFFLEQSEIEIGNADGKLGDKQTALWCVNPFKGSRCWEVKFTPSPFLLWVWINSFNLQRKTFAPFKFLHSGYATISSSSHSSHTDD